MAPRKVYDGSFQIALSLLGLEGSPRPMVERVPRADDEELGPSPARPFKNCDFEGAVMSGVVANKDFRSMTVLSPTQVTAIA